MTTYTTRYGPIEFSQVPSLARRNSYDNSLIHLYIPKYEKSHEEVTFQRPAFLAWREAEKIYGKKTRMLKLPPRLRPPRAIKVTGTYRSYDLQASLYARDHSRYAPPWTSGHVQGFCADVNTAQDNFNQIIDILEFVGWKRSRPGDEPWHVSWGPIV